MKIEKIGTIFTGATKGMITEMIIQAEWTKFKLALEKPTLLNIIPMIIRGMEYGDLFHLLNAAPVTYISSDIYIQFEKLKQIGTSGLNDAVLNGSRPCISDKPEAPSLNLF